MMRRRLTLALSFLLLVCLPARAADVDLLMGNPSQASPDPSQKDNFLMNKDFFALSYNDSKGTPNWVSWHLTKQDFGDAPRKRQFDPDETLPSGLTKITHRDDTNSGFDRGHMCPHSDRDKNTAMSFATFVMTNIVPQSNESHAGAWNQLERYARSLVMNKGKELYIIAGPQGIRGEGRNGFKNKIAGGKVTVPNRIWKVILVLEANDNDQDIERVDANTRLIAVIMPNDRSVPQDNWWQYRVSVKDVEEITGYTFFNKVPADIITPLKEEVDTEFIPVLAREH
jgi:endonuclease G, mitochondrial